MEALRINVYLTKTGFNLANRILNSTIKLPSDSFDVMNIFGKILEDKPTAYRKDLIRQMEQQHGVHSEFMKYLIETVKMNRLFLI